MKNKIAKFKKWLIRKLGGYTTQVYQVEHLPKDTITLQSYIHVPYSRDEKEEQEKLEWATDRLTEELMHEMRKYITISRSVNSSLDDVIYRATIEIIKR